MVEPLSIFRLKKYVLLKQPFHKMLMNKKR